MNDELRLIREAVEAEREACAKACDQLQFYTSESRLAAKCAEAIRGRGTVSKCSLPSCVRWPGHSGEHRSA